LLRLQATTNGRTVVETSRIMADGRRVITIFILECVPAAILGGLRSREHCYNWQLSEEKNADAAHPA